MAYYDYRAEAEYQSGKRDRVPRVSKGHHPTSHPVGALGQIRTPTPHPHTQDHHPQGQAQGGGPQRRRNPKERQHDQQHNRQGGGGGYDGRDTIKQVFAAVNGLLRAKASLGIGGPPSYSEGNRYNPTVPLPPSPGGVYSPSWSSGLGILPPATPAPWTWGATGLTRPDPLTQAGLQALHTAFPRPTSM